MGTNGYEVLYAGAGILLGAVTVCRGWATWRQGQKSSVLVPCTLQTLPLGKLSLPFSILGGAVLSIACSLYLLWRLYVL